jgi:hypothetical protein
MLERTSQYLNMNRQNLRTDTRRLAEYWEVALEQSPSTDINTGLLFLDTCLHGYLKAKGIDLGNKKLLLKHQKILAGMIVLISIYVMEQPADMFPKINDLTPIAENEISQVVRGGDIMSQVEKILKEKSEGNNRI